MNKAQAKSLAKQLLNTAAGFVAEHGWKTAGTVLNSETAIGIGALVIIWIYSHFFQHTDEQEATPTPLPDSKGGGVLPPAVGLFLVGIGLAGLLQLGCAGQNKRLELGGAYNPATTVMTTNADSTVSTNLVAVGQPDFKLYAADASFDFAYSTLEAAFKIERDNREFLWKLSPEIKHSLDAIRPKASKAVAAYAAARIKYMALPIDENATGLDAALADIQAVSDSATAAISSFNVPSTLNQ